MTREFAEQPNPLSNDELDMLLSGHALEDDVYALLLAGRVSFLEFYDWTKIIREQGPIVFGMVD